MSMVTSLVAADKHQGGYNIRTTVTVTCGYIMRRGMQEWYAGLGIHNETGHDTCMTLSLRVYNETGHGYPCMSIDTYYA